MANNAGEGMRAQRLVQKREEEKKQQQKEREQIRKDNAIHISSIDQGFVTKIDRVDDILVQNTVGLVTLDDYRKKKELIEDLQEKERRREDKRKTLEAGGKKKRKKKRKVATSKLSFGDDVDDDEGEAEGGAEAQEGPARLGKNPNVDTTFLPDRDRAEADEQARHELKLKVRPPPQP
jgi:protein FAM50